jgi:hypothetical protein
MYINNSKSQPVPSFGVKKIGHAMGWNIFWGSPGPMWSRGSAGPAENSPTHIGCTPRMCQRRRAQEWKLCEFYKVAELPMRWILRSLSMYSSLNFAVNFFVIFSVNFQWISFQFLGWFFCDSVARKTIKQIHWNSMGNPRRNSQRNSWQNSFLNSLRKSVSNRSEYQAAHGETTIHSADLGTPPRWHVSVVVLLLLVLVVLIF